MMGQGGLSCPGLGGLRRCWTCDRLVWCLALHLLEEDLETRRRESQAGLTAGPRPDTPRILTKTVNGRTIYVVDRGGGS